ICRCAGAARSECGGFDAGTSRSSARGFAARRARHSRHRFAHGAFGYGGWATGMSSSGADYPRDLVGYGRTPPHAQWPGGARVAVQFVLNHEEGAESCVLDGDPASETFLSEIIGAQAFPMRHMSMESLFEYGSRAGLWRVLRAFERRKLPLTVFAAAVALKRHAEAAAAYRELGHEIAGHGL